MVGSLEERAQWKGPFQRPTLNTLLIMVQISSEMF